jgi:hypothetical protein
VVQYLPIGLYGQLGGPLPGLGFEVCLNGPIYSVGGGYGPIWVGGCCGEGGAQSRLVCLVLVGVPFA